MKISVEYYGQLEELVGKKNEEVYFSEPINLEGFKTQMLEQNASLNKMQLSLAVNNAFTDESTVLKNEDKIAVMPPFAGG